MEVLKAAGIYGGVLPPKGAEEPETLLRQEALAWVQAHGDDLTFLLPSRVAELAEQRLAQLRRERMAREDQ